MPESPAAVPRLPTIAIVGRPNVGKSTLFNRIIGQRHAIEARESGVTRDRVTALAHWQGRRFQVIDTGGLGIFMGEKSGAGFDEAIRAQLLEALAEADRIVMVVDASAGILPLDEEVANLVRSQGKPVTVVANKADNPEQRAAASGFGALGFRDIVPISCLHKLGLDDLLDLVTADFPQGGPATPQGPVIKIALVGRPNVGKSSILNRLLGENRVIVSDVPGTTRDAIDVPFVAEVDGVRQQLVLIDTAGLRHKAKVDNVVEHFSYQRSLQAIERADVVLICLDATAPIGVQDKRICRTVYDAGKPCILLANKWDLASAEVKQKDYLAGLQEALFFMDFAPVLTCCAKSGYNFRQIVPMVVHLYSQLQTNLPTAVVNQVLKSIMVRMPAPTTGPGTLKVYYGVYKTSRPPTFLLFVNREENCHESYRAYLRNQLRQAFGFEGLPLVVELRDHHPEEANRERHQQVKRGVAAGKPVRRRPSARDLKHRCRH